MPTDPCGLVGWGKNPGMANRCWTYADIARMAVFEVLTLKDTGLCQVLLTGKHFNFWFMSGCLRL